MKVFLFLALHRQLLCALIFELIDELHLCGRGSLSPGIVGLF
jgi:hypothetical protein